MVTALPDRKAATLRWRHKTIVFFVVLLAIFLVGAALQVYLWTHRPMFHNDFQRDERTLFFSQWTLEDPVCDASGNDMTADIPLP